VQLLDRLWEQLLAVRQNDQLFVATDHVQVAGGVEAAEVAGLEPAVGGKRRRRGFGIVPVAAEYARAVGFDLARRLASRRRCDPQLDAGQWAALGAETTVRGAVEGQHRRRLRQPVPGQHRPAETFEIEREFRRQLRATAADQRE